MRFPSRGGRILLLLFGITLGPLLLVLPASAWLAWTLTPLEKFYLGNYAASSLGATQPRNVTSIRWVLKTAPGRKPVPMLPQDAVAGSNRKLPVNLSAQAVSEGWRGVELGPRERDLSSELAPWLRDSVYDGRSAPWVLGMPFLYGLVGLIFVCLALQKAKDAWGYGLSSWAQRRQEERHGRRTKGPELSLPSSLKVFRRDDGIRLKLQGESVGSKLLPWGRSYAIPKRLESSHIMLMGDTGSGKSSAIRQILRQVNDRGDTLPPEQRDPCPSRGIAVSRYAPELLEAFVRLLRLLDRPEEIAPLAPAADPRDPLPPAYRRPCQYASRSRHAGEPHCANQSRHRLDSPKLRISPAR